MTTSIEVIDTAIKIGLGSLISGVSSYFLFRQKHSADSEKEYRNEKRNLIKELAVKLEDVESHVNEAVLYLGCSDIESAKKALLPASKEIYTVRAFVNILGNSELVLIVTDISSLVEEIYSEVNAKQVNHKKLDALIVETLPRLKQSAYPFIRVLYEQTCA